VAWNVIWRGAPVVIAAASSGIGRAATSDDGRKRRRRRELVHALTHTLRASRAERGAAAFLADPAGYGDSSALSRAFGLLARVPQGAGTVALDGLPLCAAGPASACRRVPVLVAGRPFLGA
jgi:hypothetical protein